MYLYSFLLDFLRVHPLELLLVYILYMYVSYYLYMTSYNPTLFYELYIYISLTRVSFHGAWVTFCLSLETPQFFAQCQAYKQLSENCLMDTT